MKLAYVGIDLLVSALEELLVQGADILKVFTCKTDERTESTEKIRSLCLENRIPWTEQPIRYSDLTALQQSGCDALICGAYNHRLPILPGFPMLNLHPTLLPWGRGFWPMPYVLLENHSEGGITLHKMEETFDTGDILLQERFALSPDETLESYMQKAREKTRGMMRRLLSEFRTLYENAVPQGEGCFLAPPPETLYTVNAQMTVLQADRILRAFYGYDCIYENKQKRYLLWRARAVHSERPLSPLVLADGYLLAETIKEI